MNTSIYFNQEAHQEFFVFFTIDRLFEKKKLIYIKLKYFNKNCKITSYSSIPVCLLSEKYQQKNDIDMLFPILILTTNITGQIWNLKIITCAQSFVNMTMQKSKSRTGQ